MSTVVFWDLDGTILTTNRGGVPALEDAAEAVLGRRPDLRSMRTAGMTDREIATSIVRMVTGSSDTANEAALLDRYAEALPARLEEVRGFVMPHVHDVLNACAERDISLGLLTGNVERCANAKLASYGVDRDLFAFGGFSEDGYTRAEIGAAAVRRSGGRAAWDRAFVVGDTPSDVEAGIALDLVPIAVATGGFTADQLRMTDAWVVVDQLPAAAAFIDLVAT